MFRVRTGTALFVVVLQRRPVAIVIRGDPIAIAMTSTSGKIVVPHRSYNRDVA